MADHELERIFFRAREGKQLATGEWCDASARFPGGETRTGVEGSLRMAAAVRAEAVVERLFFVDTL